MGDRCYYMEYKALYASAWHLKFLVVVSVGGSMVL